MQFPPFPASHNDQNVLQKEFKNNRGSFKSDFIFNSLPLLIIMQLQQNISYLNYNTSLLFQNKADPFIITLSVVESGCAFCILQLIDAHLISVHLTF